MVVSVNCEKYFYLQCYAIAITSLSNNNILVSCRKIERFQTPFRGLGVTAVVAKIAGSTADLRGRRTYCSTAHEKWRGIQI